MTQKNDWNSRHVGQHDWCYDCCLSVVSGVYLSPVLLISIQ